MFGTRILSAIALAAAVAIAPAAAQAPTGGTAGQRTDADTKKAEEAKKAADEKKAAEEAKKADEVKKAAEEKKKREEDGATHSYLGDFETSVLAGGAINELKIPLPPTTLEKVPQNPEKGPPLISITWTKSDFEKTTFWGRPICRPSKGDPSQPGAKDPSERIYVRSKRGMDDNTATLLSVEIPHSRCWWPLQQDARVTIKGEVVGKGLQTFFDEQVLISVYWLPLVLTVLVIAIIYPGCAMVAFYLKRRRYEKDRADAKTKKQRPPPEPNFWITLDPVQITAGPHGRGSLAKLQIFLFSLIVFGLLFYYQFRCGILTGMSTDVMLLMGISSVGAVGGKAAYVKNRRLSLDNWAWLRRKGWLPVGYDVQPRAKWSELFLDSDTKEFDPYSFQMAVFSLVVAIALVRTGLGGLVSFRIPQELLALLGLSQAVFIGGKATENSGYVELDKKLTEVREHESKYLDLLKDADTKEQAKAPAELEAFHNSAVQAAEMFWAVYVEQLEARPPATAKQKVKDMIPGDIGPDLSAS